MDLPWNPAVLEQRIGRVHRMGQRRGVQVVNFVAEGTIEEGMLSLLAFKKSLFAGVLDGGESEVFLHGSRLSKFMESVEVVTGSIVGGESQAAVGSRPGGAESKGREPAQPSQTSEWPIDRAPSGAVQSVLDAAASSPDGGSANDPWAPLLAAGLRLVEAVAAASRGNGDGGSETSSPLIETDARTGRRYLKLPMPEPKAIQQLSEALTKLLSGLGARRTDPAR